MCDMVSIIMPAYNSGKYIEASIKSVLSQTYKNIELIIIDDCSVDNTQDIIIEYLNKDRRIKFIGLKTNHGVSYARNLGIKNATGNYLVFLDSDDCIYPNKIQSQYDFMKKNDYIFSYTNYRRIDSSGGVLKSRMKLSQKNNARQVLYKMSMLTSTTMISMDKIDKNSLLFPTISSSEDRACFYYFLKNNNCCAYLLDDVLTDYRVHSLSLSSNRKENIKKTWLFYRKIAHFNIFISCLYFILYLIYAFLKRV